LNGNPETFTVDVIDSNRTTQEEWQLIAAMKPFADALGDKLTDEVQAGRIRDGPEDVARAFGEIAKGL
jgi:hypothetical protein